MQLVHGGDWAGYRAEFGRDALDFSANVSPLGLIGDISLCLHIGGCNVSILSCYIKGIRCNLLFFFCSTLLCFGVIIL